MGDRKYRQSGYQDSDRGDRGARRSPSPEGPRDRDAGPPRGRGLGKPTATVFRCAVCGRQATVADLTPESTCGHCDAAFHTCTHCAHFDTSAPGECRQPEAEYVSSKAKRNDCGFYTPRLTQEQGRPDGGERPSDAKAAFDALFDL